MFTGCVYYTYPIDIYNNSLILNLDMNSASTTNKEKDTMATYLIDAGLNVAAQAGSYPNLQALLAAHTLANGDVVQYVDNGTITETMPFQILQNYVTFESWGQNVNKPTINFATYIPYYCFQVGGTGVTFRDLKIIGNQAYGIIMASINGIQKGDNITVDRCHLVNDTNQDAPSTAYLYPTLNIAYAFYPTNAVFTNNIVEGRGMMAFNSYNGLFANNTIIQLPTCTVPLRGTFLMRIKATVTIRNNIFYGSPGTSYYAINNDLQEDYNCFHNFVSYNYMVPGSHSIRTNPLFTDAANHNYTLLENSPCVDTGVSPAVLPSIPMSDFLKKPRGDGNGLWDIGAYEYSIPNYVKIISAPSVETYEDQEYTYYPIADYLGETGVQWSLSGEPSGMSLDVSTGVTGAISWTPTTGGYSTDDITLSITDGVVSAEQKWQVNVLEVNDKPVITSVPSKYVQYGGTYSYQATAIDEETALENLKWRIIGGPDGMNVDENTGLVTWNPTEPGSVTSTITLEVRDEGNLTDIQQWTITVMPIIVGQNLVEAESNSTFYIRPEMLIASDTFVNTFPEGYSVQVLDGAGYRVIPSDTENSGNYPKIHIEKASVPTCNVNVTVTDFKGRLSNTYQLVINTVNKGNGKNVTDPPILVKGKNKS